MDIPDDMAGKILLASPSLRDGQFDRSVILLTEHGPQGAHGYVLNHPLERHVDDLLSGGEFAPLAGVPVFRGGPVGLERLAFAVVGWDSRAGQLSFRSHLSTEEAREAYFAGMDVRAYVGYSGWGPGQLERELERHTWILGEAGPLLADPGLVTRLWPRVLQEMGPFHSLLALMPEHPEHN